MNTNKRNIIFPAITFALCIFLAVGVMLIFPACGPKEDGTWMSCHYAQMAVFAIGLVMAALAFIAIFAGNKIRILLYIITAVGAVFAAVIPSNIIRLCMMNEMQCRAVMRPSVILVSVLIAVFSLVSAAGAGNDRGNKRKSDR